MWSTQAPFVTLSTELGADTAGSSRTPVHSLAAGAASRVDVDAVDPQAHSVKANAARRKNSIGSPPPLSALSSLQRGDIATDRAPQLVGRVDELDTNGRTPT